MLPTDAKERKAIPVSSGCFKYFPDALVAVAQLSAIANEQHNPGEPLHWAMEKSTDEADALARHQIQHVKGEMYDGDRVLHATKVAWRALAQLQRLLMTGVPALDPRTSELDFLRAVCGWGGGAGGNAPGICGDCGVDLAEGLHAPTCLSSSAQRSLL